MPHVKLFLTPYKKPVLDDDVQTFFKHHSTGDDFIDRGVEIFSSHLKPGLKYLRKLLTHGVEHKWWHHWKTRLLGYETAWAFGMYEGDREPSLCIDLNLVDQIHARDLIVIAANFGKKFDQASVHILFSLKSEVANKAWSQENQKITNNGKGQPVTVHLATFGETIPAYKILSAAKYVGIDALTIHIMGNQLQYQHLVSAKENAKWDMLLSQLKGVPLRTPTESWVAIRFAVGRGGECTSRYDQWKG